MYRQQTMRNGAVFVSRKRPLLNSGTTVAIHPDESEDLLVVPGMQWTYTRLAHKDGWSAPWLGLLLRSGRAS